MADTKRRRSCNTATACSGFDCAWTRGCPGNAWRQDHPRGKNQAREGLPVRRVSRSQRLLQLPIRAPPKSQTGADASPRHEMSQRFCISFLQKYTGMTITTWTRKKPAIAGLFPVNFERLTKCLCSPHPNPCPASGRGLETGKANSFILRQVLLIPPACYFGFGPFTTSTKSAGRIHCL